MYNIWCRRFLFIRPLNKKVQYIMPMHKRVPNVYVCKC